MRPVRREIRRPEESHSLGPSHPSIPPFIHSFTHSPSSANSSTPMSAAEGHQLCSWQLLRKQPPTSQWGWSPAWGKLSGRGAGGEDLPREPEVGSGLGEPGPEGRPEAARRREEQQCSGQRPSTGKDAGTQGAGREASCGLVSGGLEGVGQGGAAAGVSRGRWCSWGRVRQEIWAPPPPSLGVG